MFVFLVANLPLPLLCYLNILVTLKFWRVRKLAKRRPVDRPGRLVVGWWLCNLSTLFALTPAIWERRIFVQNRWWLVCYAIASMLSITGLLLMNSGLGEEIHELLRQPAKKRRKRV